jgi:hypothetical protein
MQEGQYIKYRTNLAGIKLVTIARKLKLDRSAVSRVIYGKRRSSRIETEIARILGKASWNDVVLEARSEVQKKPVKIILQEMEQKTLAKRKTVINNMAAHIAEGLERDMPGLSAKAATTAKTRRRA